MNKLRICILLAIILLSNCTEQKDSGIINNGLIEDNMTLNLKFNNWLKRINENEKIDSSIIAFNFGIFESPEGYKIYLIGAKKYDENDEDWATYEDYSPKEKYFPLEINTTDGKDWEEVLKISTDLVTQYVNSDDYKNSIFKNAKAITTGFDEGDLIRIK